MRCSEVRGFNYDGSWGTSALDLWQHHNHGLMAVEVARGKHYFPKWNLCRWWLSEGSFQRNPDRFLANLEGGLSILAQHDILAMPLLFNRWRDPGPREPVRIERLHLSYLEAVVGAHKDDPRIFAWDLCNEPLMAPYVDDPDSPIRAAELRWLTWCYKVCKQTGATQPLTIGNYPGRTVLGLTEPISDILSTHPYYVWNAPHASTDEFGAFLDHAVQFAQSKDKNS